MSFSKPSSPNEGKGRQPRAHHEVDLTQGSYKSETIVMDKCDWEGPRLFRQLHESIDQRIQQVELLEKATREHHDHTKEFAERVKEGQQVLQGRELELQKREEAFEAEQGKAKAELARRERELAKREQDLAAQLQTLRKQEAAVVQKLDQLEEAQRCLSARADEYEQRTASAATDGGRSGAPADNGQHAAAAHAEEQAIPAERRPAAANPAASELDQPKAEPLPAAMGKQVEQPFGTATIDISEDPDEPAPHSKAPGPPAAQDDSETESMPLPGSPLPEDDVPSSEPHHQQHQQGDAQPAEQPVEQGATVVHTGAVAEHSADPGASDMQIDLEQERAGLSQGARMAESQPSNGDAAAASEAALGAEERTVPSQQAAAAGAQTAMPAEEDSCAAAAEEAAVAGREAEWYSPAAWGDAVVGRQPPPAVEPTAGRLVPPPQPAASQNGRNHEHPAHPAGPENADWGPTSERGADGGAPPQDAATPAAGWPAEQPPAVSGANQRLQHRSAAALQPHLLSRKRKHAKKKNWEDLQNGGNQEGLPNGSKALGVNGHFPQESARASGWDPLHNLIPQRSWGSSTRARRGHSPPRSRWSQRQEAARDARPPANVADEALESLAAHQPDGSAQPDAAGRANGQRGGRGARGRGRAGRLSRRLAGPEATPGMRACIDQLKAIYGSDPEEGAERGAAHAPEVRAPAAEPQAAAAL